MEKRFKDIVWHNWLRAYGFGGATRSMREARLASLLSVRTVAKRMKVAPSYYARLEHRESQATIQTLKEFAKALDAEFIYEIRPREARTFAHRIFYQIRAAIDGHPWLRSGHEMQKALKTAHLMRRKLYNAKFRREKGWCRNSREKPEDLW